MKILYGIAGTGNGHLSRGAFIYNILKKHSSNIDVLISGTNYSLRPSMPIKYRNKGITFSIDNGKIDYLKTLANLDLFTSYIEQKKIPFKDYDLIITDFDPVSAWGSVRYRIPSIHISHQASFLDSNVPRPDNKNIIGEYVMKYFCPTNDYIGLHYKSYGKNISEPLISDSIKSANIELKNHVTVYLPWYKDDFLITVFKKMKNLNFQVFSRYVKSNSIIDNCQFFPIDHNSFVESMRRSYGVICNAGFQTSSEVLYLGKRLIVIPVEGQYEQICNVAALNQLGVRSLNVLNSDSIHEINEWVDSKPVQIKFQNNLEQLLEEKIIKK